ncbi:MAG TPA: YceD family protein [Chitinolyticbacter sp.]|nr:YceD family protein [Chitinolyticbacter sp.]
MTVIHSAEFAKEKQSLEGSVEVAALARLADQLADQAGVVNWRLVGGVDRYQRPYLVLTLRGELNLVCQRCLKPLAWSLKGESVLTQFVDEESLDDAENIDEDLEGMLIEPELDVQGLVEDEVLLSLPLAPRHVACGDEDEAVRAAAKPNPFAVLAGLKTRKAE